MSYILVIGPCWNELKTLINTIDNNCRFLTDIKRIYVATNDATVHKFFCDLKNPKIISNHFYENQGHQTSCFNSIIAGMKMVIDNEKNDDDDVVIFSHEDVYIKDMNLFNKCIKKLNNGYDIVCREYTGSKKGDPTDYYMNDAFFIKKKIVKTVFGNSCMKTINVGNSCENEFTSLIKDQKIFSAPYYDHSTFGDSELGFHHLVKVDIGIPFWNKKNIDEIYKD
jgi:hypothetical protein